MATSKVALDEVMGLQRYEEARDECRRRIIALKQHRRVSVGDRVTFVFENHDTMWFQVHEMLRAEQIVDLDRVRDEIEVYNQLVPDAGELSATMLIEITDSQRIRDDLVSLIGIDESVYIEAGAHRVNGEFEGGRSRDDKMSAVQYVRFKFDPAAREAFLDPARPVRLAIDHPNYRHSTVLGKEVRESLAVDLS